MKRWFFSQFRESGQEWLPFVWCLSHRLELALKDALADVMEPIKKCLTNLFYLYKKSSKKLRELRKLHKVLAEVYVFENGRVKPSKCSWIAHLLRSMSGLVDKFSLYLQHFENIIADPSNNKDKSTLEGKQKLLTDASILLRSALFRDLLDSAKIFSLSSQKEDLNLIVMVDRLDDMIFSYELMKRGFSKKPESVYNLPHVDKVLKDVVCEHDKNGKKVYKYQDIKLDYFEREKSSLANNVESYVDLILDAIKERFGGISEDDQDLEGAPTAGDMFLRDICCIIDSRKWILPGSVLPSAENIELCFEKNLCCIERVFTQFEMILSKVNPSINIASVQQEYSRIIFFCLQNFQTHLHSPYKLWQYLYQLRDDKDWQNIFTLIELCMCSPCSNAALERFFSQMRMVKTDWRNCLNEENLTHLLCIKVAGPPLREFHDTVT